jgi:hypothetical protein
MVDHFRCGVPMLETETFTTEVVSALKALGRNWDGEGAAKLSPRAIRPVQTVLEDFESKRLPMPRVRAMPSGSVNLRWASHSRDLCLDFLPIGATLFTQISRTFDVDGECLSTTTSQGHFTGTKAVDQLIAWFLLENAREA